MSNTGGEIQPAVYVMVIGFPIIAIVDPVRDRAHICGQMLVLTDSRVMLIHKNISNESKTLSLKLDDIDKIQVMETETGFGRIYFGSAGFETKPGSKTRRLAIRGATDKNEALQGLLFYRLTSSDIAAVCSVLQEKDQKSKIVV